MEGYNPVLIGVAHVKDFFPELKEILSKHAKPGLTVGIEYLQYAYDDFWQEVVKYCESRGMKVVFLDSPFAHKVLDRLEKQETQANARVSTLRKMYIEDIAREKIMLKKILRGKPGLILTGVAHSYFFLKDSLNPSEYHYSAEKRFKFPLGQDLYMRERLNRFAERRRARKLKRARQARK